MVAHNAKEQFYYYFKEYITDDAEWIIAVRELEINSGFFELCKTFADVGLNATKNRVEGTNELISVFRDNDIEKAVAMTKEFIDTHKIQDVEQLFCIIKKMVGKAVEWDDERPRSTVLFLEQNGRSPRTGKYFDFTQLPSNIWEEITQEVEAEV